MKEWQTMKYDVAIVGGGPAGMQAAIEIAKRGGKVVLIDENVQLGGKLNGQLHEESHNKGWWIGKQIAQEMIDEAKNYGVSFLLGVQVWSIEKDWTLYTSSVNGKESEQRRITCDFLILATGAIEKGLPIPGWTLPKVLTVGAAQVLTNQYLVRPGNRVAVIGIDILSLSIARAMKLSGVDVVGIYLPAKNVFSNDLSEPLQVLEKFQSMTQHAPNKLMKMGGIFLKFKVGREMAAKFYPKNGMKVWGIPLYINQAVQEIKGHSEVEGIVISRVDGKGNELSKRREENVDAVCISAGLTPQNELAVLAGCKFVTVAGLSGSVPIHDEYLETTVPTLFVAGNITGIEGAKVSRKQGKLAGLSIANKLGLLNDENEIVDAIKEVHMVRETADIQFHHKVIEGRQNLQKIWQTNYGG
jgi:sarcosine oxidase subunit alpha